MPYATDSMMLLAAVAPLVLTLAPVAWLAPRAAACRRSRWRALRDVALAGRRGRPRAASAPRPARERALPAPHATAPSVSAAACTAPRLGLRLIHGGALLDDPRVVLVRPLRAPPPRELSKPRARDARRSSTATALPSPEDAAAAIAWIEGVLETIDCGALVLDARGTVVAANALASGALGVDLLAGAAGSAGALLRTLAWRVDDPAPLVRALAPPYDAVVAGEAIELRGPRCRVDVVAHAVDLPSGTGRALLVRDARSSERHASDAPN